MIPIIDKQIDEYCLSHTSSEPALLQELMQETRETMEYPQMLSGRVEGRLLKFLVQQCKAEVVVEIGTFTGYSALSMAEGLSESGRLYTCDINPDAIAFAQKYFDRSPHGKKITQITTPGIEFLKSCTDTVDFAFIDADKEGYADYYEALLPHMRQGALMVFDNMLWSGKVLKPDDEDSRALDGLNKKLRTDDRVEHVLLPVRDGIHIVQKK